ncbi:hypothetical protein AYO38_02780 [bacterium SCGC AG-212-C10]|nr:hypothetical protein AYO38_02780 [bacterium SCGC AG-212-C10]
MQFYDISYPQALRGLRQHAILPGDIEPEWLYRNAEQRRILGAKEAEEKDGSRPARPDEREARAPRGVVDRVRQAFSRAL